MIRACGWRRALAASLALSGLAANAAGTWAIVALDRSTHEVCVASATCVPNGNVHFLVPIIAVDRGVAAALFTPTPMQNGILFDLLHQGFTPPEILTILQSGDLNWGIRQYGILNFTGPPATHSGAQTDIWTGGLVGDFGAISYALQGNSLAGAAVLDAARAALIATDGDLGQKVMAAMEAAAAMGGDGRCSCSGSAPTSCGTPPPSFTHTAFTSSIVLARVGDRDGSCGGLAGCANGQYYLKRRINGRASDLDAVVRLRAKYDAWRAARVGKADHLLTRVVQSATRAVADGMSVIDVTLELRDLDDARLASGGQSITIVSAPAGADVAQVGPLTDNGDGTHSFSLNTTLNAGHGEWIIAVQAGAYQAQLYPNLMIEVDPPVQLHAGVVRAVAHETTVVPFTLGLGPTFAGRPYQILGSASGTTPGTNIGGLLVPLNDDRLLAWTRDFAGGPVFGGALGVLDANGRATAQLALPAAGLESLIGARLDFCAVLPATAGSTLTNLVAVEVLP